MVRCWESFRGTEDGDTIFDSSFVLQHVRRSAASASRDVDGIDGRGGDGGGGLPRALHAPPRVLELIAGHAEGGRRTAAHAPLPDHVDGGGGLLRALHAPPRVLELIAGHAEGGQRTAALALAVDPNTRHGD
jgi:hypothetical protein